MALKDYATTKEGIEMQFGSNHVGHFLLTNLLMPKLLAAGKSARVVNVSSFGYMSGGVYFDDPNFKVSKENSALIAQAFWDLYRPHSNGGVGWSRIQCLDCICTVKDCQYSLHDRSRGQVEEQGSSFFCTEPGM